MTLAQENENMLMKLEHITRFKGCVSAEEDQSIIQVG